VPDSPHLFLVEIVFFVVFFLFFFVKKNNKTTSVTSVQYHVIFCIYDVTKYCDDVIARHILSGISE